MTIHFSVIYFTQKSLQYILKEFSAIEDMIKFCTLKYKHMRIIKLYFGSPVKQVILKVRFRPFRLCNLLEEVMQ